MADTLSDGLKSKNKDPTNKMPLSSSQTLCVDNQNDQTKSLKKCGKSEKLTKISVNKESTTIASATITSSVKPAASTNSHQVN